MAIFQKIKRSAMKNCLRTTTVVLLVLIAFQTWNQTLDRIFKKRSSGSFIRFYTQMQWEGTIHDISTNKSDFVTENEKPCAIPKHPRFPLCSLKIQTFNDTWNENCHGKRYKVNKGDLCSVIKYLSEIESWCPVLPWRKDHDPLKGKQSQTSKTRIRTDLQGVLDLLREKRLAWMRSRLRHTWEQFVEAIKELSIKQKMVELPKKKIYLFFGTFSFMPWFLDNAFSGGSLGELVQWTDVIGSLYLLGHDLVVTLNDTEVKRILTPPDSEGCAARELRDNFDFIITDIYGYMILERITKPNFSRYRCRLIILDSFGTDAEYNYEHYKDYLRPSGKSFWGKLNLFLPQFFTLYPHSPDNSFMGFAVPKAQQPAPASPEGRKNVAIIYGKNFVHWKGRKKYLDEMKKYFEIHANVAAKENSPEVPSYVHHHGVVNTSHFSHLLQGSKVFVGLGEPYEGPGPLDALANGCFFINPKFQPAKGPLNTPFFDNKPMSRTLTSQNPYAEIFVGKPFVHTIDIGNPEEIKQAAKEILESKAQPRLPYEFSHEGMLQRLSAYIQNQDFCHSEHTWPPLSELHRHIGDPGVSCIDVCWRNGLICENTFFVVINKAEEFSKFRFQCKSYVTRETIVAPSFNQTDGSCLLQEQSLLFSCRASAPRVQRLCPCRTFINEQVALCKSCAS